MKKVLLIGSLALLLTAGASAQLVKAVQFPGNDVGTKVSNAVNLGCNPDTSVTCVIEIAPEFSSWASGPSFPTCARCTYLDYRTPGTDGISGGAPLTSPNFLGVPTAPTPSTGDNSTRLATTAYVKAQGIGTQLLGVSIPAMAIGCLNSIDGASLRWFNCPGVGSNTFTGPQLFNATITPQIEFGTGITSEFATPEAGVWWNHSILRLRVFDGTSNRSFAFLDDVTTSKITADGTLAMGGHDVTGVGNMVANSVSVGPGVAQDGTVTTVGQCVKRDGSGHWTLCGTSDSTAREGIVTSVDSVSLIHTAGFGSYPSILADASGSIAAGDYVVSSTTTPGSFKDSGVSVTSGSTPSTCWAGIAIAAISASSTGQVWTSPGCPAATAPGQVRGLIASQASATDKDYMFGAGTGSACGTAAACDSVEDRSETIGSVYAMAQSAMSAGGTVVLTLIKNDVTSPTCGSPSPITVTFSASDPAGQVRTDLTNTCLVVAGDRLRWHIRNNSSGNSGSIATANSR